MCVCMSMNEYVIVYSYSCIRTMELFRSSGLSCFMDIIASEITNTDDKYKKELFVASVNYCLFFFLT